MGDIGYKMDILDEFWGLIWVNWAGKGDGVLV